MISAHYLLILAIAFMLDVIIGDPVWLYHPVRLIGHYITFYEKQVRKVAKTDKQLKIAGFWLLISTMIVTAVVCGIILFGLWKLGRLWYDIGVCYFAYAALSTKCLAYEANMVKKALDRGIKEGRNRVAYIVGRDTSCLSEEEVIKATVETVAENTTDGIVAPLLYLLIGGPVLAFVFKAVSTLDSMVGYKNEKYADLGYFSAKFDDVLNYIPARLCGVLMSVSAFLVGLDGKNAFKILKRDRRNHLSPNCAFAESAAAGALNIMLGGTHEYFGKTVVKPTIGDNNRPIEKQDISRMNRLMFMTAWLTLLLFILLGWSL